MGAGKQRILIIDDEVRLTRLLKVSLELTGAYDVYEANSGSEGLAAAKQVQPDLILLDVIMPDLGGTDVVAQLAADERLRRVPVVWLTATVSPQASHGAQPPAGGAAALAKPVTVEQVIRCIEQHLSGVGHSE